MHEPAPSRPPRAATAQVGDLRGQQRVFAAELRQGGDDALAGQAVAVGVVGEAHRFVGGAVAQQTADALADQLAVGTDQAHRAGGHRFRPLGGVAHHQHRLAQRRRFFLDAAGVGEDDVGAVHQVHERQVVQRLDQMHVGDSAQHAVDR
ncbi:hypothetical protein CATMIT_01622, partial [Catenibacterium mitsuokai DSM 15897]